MKCENSIYTLQGCIIEKPFAITKPPKTKTTNKTSIPNMFATTMDLPTAAMKRKRESAI